MINSIPNTKYHYSHMVLAIRHVARVYLQSLHCKIINGEQIMEPDPVMQQHRHSFVMQEFPGSIPSLGFIKAIATM